MKIIVADDDRVLSELVCAIVRQGGHMPIPAYDSMQTLMFAMRPPVPDLIILDINMPGGTGLDALIKLKRSARTSPIPVLVLSGSTEQDMPEQVRALGAVRFLAKPIDPEALAQAIRRVFGEPETAGNAEGARSLP